MNNFYTSQSSYPTSAIPSACVTPAPTTRKNEKSAAESDPLQAESSIRAGGQTSGTPRGADGPFRSNP